MRNYSIDSFRFIAIAFIVMLHSATIVNSSAIEGALLNQIARFAVPYFFIVAGFFFYQHAQRHPDEIIAYLVKYGKRIFFIYIFWYAIYASWPLYSPSNWENIVKNGFTNEAVAWWKLFVENFKAHKLYFMLAGGKGFHLWFLPSLGMAIVLLAISLRLHIFNIGLTLSAILFAVALLGAPYKDTAIGLPISFEPRNGPFFSSIFVFIGAVLAKYTVKTSFRFALFLMLAGLLISLAEVFYIKNEYGTAISLQNYVFGTLVYATGFTLIALSGNNYGTQYKLHQLGQLTLGIYVIHVLIIWILQSIDLWPANNLVRVITCLVLSTLVSKIFSQVPILRKVTS